MSEDRQAATHMATRKRRVAAGWLSAAVLALTCFVTATIAIRLGRPQAGVSGVWMASAITLSVLLRGERRQWPLSFGAMFLGCLAAYLATHHQPATAIGFTAAHLIEVAAALFLIRRWLGPRLPRKGSLGHYVRLQAVAAALAPAIGAGIGMAIAHATGDLPPVNLGWTWWSGGALGAVLALPIALSGTRRNVTRAFGRPQVVEFLVLAVVSAATTCLALAYTRFPFVLFSLPLAVTALRTSPFATALTVGASAASVIILHLAGLLPDQFADGSGLNVSSAFVGALALLMPFCFSLIIEQQKDERARIADSEERFRNAMEHSAIGMALVGRDGGWLQVNRSLCEMLGYSATELQSRTFQEITHPDDLAADLALVDQVLRGEIDTYRMEKRYFRKDGSLVWALLAASCVRDKATGMVLYFISQVEDITARKAAETALERSESRWNFALESARQGVWDHDGATGKTVYSPLWLEMFGQVEREVVFDKPAWLELVHPQDIGPLQEAIEEHRSGKREFLEAEFRMRRADGSWIWVHDRGRVVEQDANGKDLRVIGTHTDITARKIVEERLARLTHRMELAVKAGGVGLWEYNPTTGELWWDARMCELYAVSPSNSDDAFRLWKERLHPDDRWKVEEEGRAAAAGLRPYDTEFRIVLPSGEIRYIRALADVVRDEEGTSTLLIGTNWDITEHRLLTDALLGEKERLRTTLQSIGDAVVSTDTQSRITFMNKVAEDLTGYSAAAIVGQHIDRVFKVVDEASGQLVQSPIEACLSGATSKSTREGITLLSPKGRRDIRETAAPVRTAAGEIVGVVIVLQDMTEARHLQRQLTHSATHDALTGLANRASFEAALDAACAEAANGSRQHAVCFVDLDRFKIVNDTAGHAAGDALLREIGRIIRESVRGHDVTARLGGDEFGLLLYDCAPEQAEIVAEKMIQSVRALPFAWDGRAYDVGASVGLTVVSAASAAPGEILSQADIACYAAKGLGRNRVAVYRAEEGEARQQHRNLKVAARIRGAIESDRFRLYAQEIRPLQPNRSAERHYEILLRMLDEDGTVLDADAFIPAAERYDLMANIDRWVFSAVLGDYGARIAAEPNLSISVNLSANSLSDQHFWPFLERQLVASSLPASRLRLEITETALINNLSASSILVGSAREAGCAIVLDDFGTGLSSFAYLKRFPVDYLKIDGSFMRTLTSSSVDRAIVESINDIAHKLGAATIAEWVENEETAEILRALGIDHAQGFAIAPPVPLDQILSATNVVPRQGTLRAKAVRIA